MLPSFDLIKQVVLSWQVIVVCVSFIIFWSICSSIVSPHKKRILASSKKQKPLKRPTEKAELKNADTGGLGLGE
jgi:cell division protein FtsL